MKRYHMDDGGGISLEGRTARLYSWLSKGQKKQAAQYFVPYLIQADKKADPESRQDTIRKIGFVKYLFHKGESAITRPISFVGYLLARSVFYYLSNYKMMDGLLLYDHNDKIMGHAIFQIHSNKRPLEIATDYKLDPDQFQLHMFQIAVDKKYKPFRATYALELLESLIRISGVDGNIEILRFGRGNNDRMNKLNKIVKEQNSQVQYMDKGYFRFT